MRKLKKFNALKRNIASPFFVQAKVLAYKKSKWGAIRKKLKKLTFFSGDTEIFTFSQFFKGYSRAKLKRKKITARVRRRIYIRRCRFLRFFNTNLKKHYFSKKWRRFKEISRNAITIKTQLHHYFACAFSAKFYKAILSPLHKKQQLYSTFVRPEYRIDLLLFRLCFFESPQAAEVALRSRKVLINNGRCSLNKFVKTGDLIRVLRPSNALKKNTIKFFAKHRLPSFVEVDYFCNEIIIVFNWFEVQQSFLVGEIKINLPLRNLRYCLTR